jgi:pilus assembly protein CpaF
MSRIRPSASGPFGQFLVPAEWPAAWDGSLWVWPWGEGIHLSKFAHANSARHLLWRLETMAMMSDVDLPVEHVRGQVASAIDVVVHMARMPDGRRVVSEIATVEDVREGQHVTRTTFRFRPHEGRAGVFICSGDVPPLRDALRERGETLPGALFAPGEDCA